MSSSSSHHMEGSEISKKRKSSRHDSLALIEEDEEEEKKMEEFFSLVRSIREVRDRLRNGSSAGIKEEESKAKGKKNKFVEEAAAIWNPSFQPEDFVEDRDPDANNYKVKVLQGPPPPAPPSPMDYPTKGRRTSDNEDTTDALDLNLSL